MGSTTPMDPFWPRRMYYHPAVFESHRLFGTLIIIRPTRRLFNNPTRYLEMRSVGTRTTVTDRRFLDDHSRRRHSHSMRNNRRHHIIRRAAVRLYDYLSAQRRLTFGPLGMGTCQ